ncbi:MAG: transcriptional repressor [Bacteroidota bacterium]
MSSETTIKGLLDTHKLRKTIIRTEILGIFMKYDFALSVSDLVDKLDIKNDRVTVYRALATFEECGILHKASEGKHGVKYALCRHSLTGGNPTPQHAHFVCKECNQTFCLENVLVPKVEVSDDFLVDRIDYTLSGVCNKCKNTSQKS